MKLNVKDIKPNLDIELEKFEQNKKKTAAILKFYTLQINKTRTTLIFYTFILIILFLFGIKIFFSEIKTVGAEYIVGLILISLYILGTFTYSSYKDLKDLRREEEISLNYIQRLKKEGNALVDHIFHELKNKSSK
jgi:hypothetical protein